MITKLLLVYLCGLIDRYRGDRINVFISKPVESIIYGLVVGSIIGLDTIPLLLFSGLWALGASFGWGDPLGALLVDKPMAGDEWWQFGILKTNTILACMFRGLMWGACTAPIIFYTEKVFILDIGMMFIFPLAIVLAKRLTYITDDSWARQEFYRGWLVGSLAFLIGCY